MKLASAKLLRRPYTILSGQPCVCWLVSFIYTRSREHIWLYQSAGDRSIYTAERALCRRPNERGATSVFARICAIYKKKHTHTMQLANQRIHTIYTHANTHALCATRREMHARSFSHPCAYSVATRGPRGRCAVNSIAPFTADGHLYRVIASVRFARISLFVVSRGHLRARELNSSASFVAAPFVNC